MRVTQDHVTLESNADKFESPPSQKNVLYGADRGEYDLVTESESKISELEAGIQVFYINEGKFSRCPEIQIKCTEGIYVGESNENLKYFFES
jgi:hypothetical protein